MGRFVPAIPISKKELIERGIDFSEIRYCQPYITDTVLWEISGGNEAGVKKFLKPINSAFLAEVKLAVGRESATGLKRIEH